MTQRRLPDSLWAATAIATPETPTLKGNKKTGVAIVGGGYAGLSAALHLAEAGANVVLLEAAEPGWGASGRNGGQVVPGFKAFPHDILARFGEERGRRMFAFSGGFADVVFDLIDRHRIDCEASRSGWIQGAHSSAAMSKLTAWAEAWRETGAAVEMIDRSETERLLGTAWYCGGMLDRRAGRVQPLSYARGLAHAALQAGATLHGNTVVSRIERTGFGWHLHTGNGRVEADQVILCTNAYSDLAGPDAPWPGVARSFIPVFTYQVATAPLSDNVARSILPDGHVAADIKNLTNYFRLESDNRLIMGGRGGTGESTDIAHYKDVISRLHEFFPQIGDPEVEYHWGGKVAVTSDHVPHIHNLADRLWTTLGYNGRGIAAATSLGKLLAELLSGTDTREVAMPVTRLNTIPFHSLRLPVVQAIAWWKGKQDKRQHARG